MVGGGDDGGEKGKEGSFAREEARNFDRYIMRKKKDQQGK